MFDFRIHSDGFKFIAIFSIATIFLFLLSTILGLIGIILTVWCVFFFRNPERTIPTDKSAIVSPADGRVVLISKVIPPSNFNLGNEERVRVSIFLNIFNVHVNRIPFAGKVKKIIYNQGKFFNASLDKASEDNERNAVIMDIENGKSIAVVQIAGLIARRIRCDIKDGDSLKTGDIYGIIRFGSRVDVYLPVGTESLVSIGQTSIAGETIIAKISNNKLIEKTKSEKSNNEKSSNELNNELNNESESNDQL